MTERLMDLKQVLKEVIDELLFSLHELEQGRDHTNAFCTGQIYAFVTILEMLQAHLHFDPAYHLNISIEDIFPLD